MYTQLYKYNLIFLKHSFVNRSDILHPQISKHIHIVYEIHTGVDTENKRECSLNKSKGV